MTALTGAFSSNPTGMMKNKIPSGYKHGQLAQFTPEQMQLYQQLFGSLQPGLSQGLAHLGGLAAGDQSKFAELEAPALRQFSQLQGNLASRFSGLGSGARRSSGFGHATSSASQELAERLQSQRLGLRNQAIEQLMGLSQSLLGQRPYHQFLTEKGPSGWEKAAGIGLPLLGAAAGAFGGPMGAAMGAQLGSSLGGAFTGRGGGVPNFSGIGDLPKTWGG